MASSDRGAEDALQEPMRRFVREARVRIALLVNGSGKVLAQHGFGRAYQVMNVAALAAATHASSRALAEVTGAGRWNHLHHAGRERQLYLAPVHTPVGDLIVVAIFDRDSSLGLVQLFAQKLERELASVAPRIGRPRLTAETFEQDLEAGLERPAASASGEG